MKAAIQEIFAKWSGKYSGSCLVKSAEETIFAAAAGYANLACGAANQVTTKYDTASVTKLFTAAAALLLVERGLLRLDDKITDVIDLAGTMIPRDVTIAQLLNHTSGIADDAEEEDGEDYSALFVTKPNYSIRECEDFLPQFAYKKPNFQAGTAVRYNNCAFVLLGMAIEKLSGLRYRDFVAREIFEKCNMQHTKFCAMDEVNPNTAEGYITIVDPNTKAETFRKNIYAFPPRGTPDSGAYTTVADLDRFIRAIVNAELLSPQYAKAMLEPHCSFTRPHRCGTWASGYAFEFVLTPKKEVFCIFKDGMNAGVEAMAAYYPKLDISVCLLSNQNGVLYDLHRELQAYFYQIGI